jgi:hypothetical protein
MLDASHLSDQHESGADSLGSHAHPDEVLGDPRLTFAQKRGILASWASDARAVLDAPALRQLESGVVLHIDIILDALKVLDAEEGGAPMPLMPQRWVRPSRRRRMRSWMRFVNRCTGNDDDDPPPTPAAAKVPRPNPSLYGAVLAAA